MSKRKRKQPRSIDDIVADAWPGLFDYPVERSSDEALIRESMRDFGYTREGAIEELRAWGGI
jgi:hypothetical protein